MANRVRVLTVCDADRVELARRVRAKGSPAREVERARIVLLAADGVPGKQIAARSPSQTVNTLTRFAMPPVSH